MNTKALMIMMLLISASTLGLVGFYTGTAEHYSVDTTEINTFKAHFDQYTSIDAKLKALQTSLTNIQILNPLTWNNIILVVLNFFSVLFELPFMFHAIVASMVDTVAFLPAFTTYIIEGAVLLIVVFGALSALKGGNA